MTAWCGMNWTAKASTSSIDSTAKCGSVRPCFSANGAAVLSMSSPSMLIMITLTSSPSAAYLACMLSAASPQPGHQEV